MILPAAKEAPPDRLPFAWEALSRLPLAESFYSLWAYLAPDPVLADLFERHRGRCYQDQLTFPELVSVLVDALTRYEGSGNRSLIDALERQRLSCQARAAYGKLGRLPLPLAEAFLSCLTARLRPLFPPGVYRSALPACLNGLAVVVLDGKKIKKAAKRLLATRGRPGKLFGGKALVAYLPAEGLAVAMAADPDGEANDCRLVPRLLPLARAAVAGPRLWVADSQFCDLEQPASFAREWDHFLVRFTLRNGFHPDPGRPARAGIDSTGRRYTEEWGWMGSEKDSRRLYVRRITLERPGEEAIAVVTDLLDEGAYPAEDLLEVYLLRWQIENVFQAITEVFGLKHLIGCAPGATVFQASLCLVIYNVLQLVRGHIAAGRPEPTKVAELSAEKIFEDMHEELVSLHTVLKTHELLGCLGGLAPESAEEMAGRLRERLGGLWKPRWTKAPSGKPRPQQPKAKQSGAHTSVHKLLQAAKAAKAANCKKQKASTLSG